jgi:hypothetical protein
MIAEIPLIFMADKEVLHIPQETGCFISLGINRLPIIG